MFLEKALVGMVRIGSVPGFRVFALFEKRPKSKDSWNLNFRERAESRVSISAVKPTNFKLFSLRISTGVNSTFVREFILSVPICLPWLRFERKYDYTLVRRGPPCTCVTAGEKLCKIG